MFKVSVKDLAYTDRQIQKIIMFPDGQRRMLSMSQWYWDTAEEVNENGWPFFELLGGAITLAKKYPSTKGFEADIHEETCRMIRTAYHGLCDERTKIVNDNAISINKPS